MYGRKSEGGLKIRFDQRVREALFDVFACLIPKQGEIESFKHEAAYRYFLELEKVIYLDETQGDMWVLYYGLTNLSRLKSVSRDVTFVLDRRSFQKSLENMITDLVNRNRDVFIRYLSENGIETNLDIQKNLEDASNFVYSSTLDTFDELSDEDLDVNDCLKYIDILKNVVLSMLSMESLTAGAEILSSDDGRYINGRVYKGPEDYVEYLSVAKNLVASRFTDYLSTNRKSVSLTDLTTLKQFKSDDIVTIKPLFSLGWEPLEGIPISTGDIITLVGDEGVGKTNTAIYMLMKNIMNGGSVLMMTGESSISKILNMCISHYLYLQTGKQVQWKEIMNIGKNDDDIELPDDIIRLIQVWQADFVENPNIGRVHLVQNMNYEDFDSTIKDYITKFPDISFVVIDHTDRLGSTGALTDDGWLREKKQKVDHLYKKEIELKQEHNLAFLNLTHSNTETQKAGVKGRDTGVRIGATSSATTKDADFVFYMSKDPNLNDKFIKWSCKKIRDFRDGVKPFILRKEFEVSSLVYDIDDQSATLEDDDEGLTIDDMY